MKKRIQVLADRMRVISDNKKRYEPFDVDPVKLKINGKAIWFARVNGRKAHKGIVLKV